MLHVMKSDVLHTQQTQHSRHNSSVHLLHHSHHWLYSPRIRLVTQAWFGSDLRVHVYASHTTLKSFAPPYGLSSSSRTSFISRILSYISTSYSKQTLNTTLLWNAKSDHRCGSCLRVSLDRQVAADALDRGGKVGLCRRDHAEQSSWRRWAGLTHSVVISHLEKRTRRQLLPRLA